MNTDEFNKRELGQGRLPADPLDDGSLEYNVHPLALTSLTVGR